MSEFTTLFGQFIERYRNDPVGYLRDIHRIELDQYQRPIAEALAQGDSVAVKSGHGVGKTTTISGLVSWYCNTRAPWRIAVTAPTSKQLWDALWPDIRTRFKELPSFLQDNFDVKAERIELKADPDGCYVSARTTSKERPEALQGIHSKHVLLVADEASGIDDEVFNAGQGSMSTPGAQTLLTGNPTRRTGFFFRAFNDPDMAGLFRLFTINAENSPWVDRDFITRIERMFGRDSNEYRYRVLGEFPEGDDESFISRDVVIEAMQREIIAPPVRPIWGLDPARFGKDRTSFCERMGPVTAPLTTWGGMDTMHTVGFVLRRYRACFPGEEPSQIIVDVIGIGAGVVDRLGELGLPVLPVNVAESPPMNSEGVKLRDELWIRGRRELYARACALPYDKDFADQLSQPTYEYTSDGRIKIESKEAMKKRLNVGSPDMADSWLLTFAGDASVVLGGATGFNRPLRRGVRVV